MVIVRQIIMLNSIITISSKGPRDETSGMMPVPAADNRQITDEAMQNMTDQKEKIRAIKGTKYTTF